MKGGNSSKVLAQMTLNATTMSVMLNNLTTSATYNIRVVAYTRIGAGPYSLPVCVVFTGLLENSNNNVTMMHEFRMPYEIHNSHPPSDFLQSKEGLKQNFNLVFKEIKRDICSVIKYVKYRPCFAKYLSTNNEY